VPAALAARPVAGAGAIPPEYEGYVRALRRRIEERLVYPWLAVRQGTQGTVELEVQLDAAGRLSDVAVVGRPIAGVLRDAAIRAIREATPFPFPPGLAARALTIRLPVVFELR
jgi:TonB family protein